MLSITGSCVRRALATTILSVLPAIPLAAILLAPAPRAMAQGCQSGWLPGDGVPGTDGEVYASVMWDPDGDGPLGKRLVIGGTFKLVEKTLARGVATWSPDTKEWSPMGDGLGWRSSGGVISLAVLPNGDLVAGGPFSNGTGAYGLARWTGSRWDFIGPADGPHNVKAICTLPNGELAVCAEFDNHGDPPYAVGSWNGSRWRILGRFSDYGPGISLAVRPNGDLIVGGGFQSVNDVPAVGVACWDGVAWHSLDEGLHHSFGSNGVAYSVLTLPDGSVMVGGAFERAGTIQTDSVARWDGTSWQALGRGLKGYVYSLKLLPDGRVAAGGEMWGHWPDDGRSFAVWDGAAWRFKLPLRTSASIESLTVLPNGGVFIGGTFNSLQGTAYSNAAIWNEAAGWSGFGSGIYGRVDSMTQLEDGRVVAAGGFSGGWGNTYVAGLASWDHGGFTGIGATTYGGINAVSRFDGGGFVVAGSFTNFDDVSLNRVARWDGHQWNALRDGLQDEAYTILSLPNGDVVAGGRFQSSVNGTPLSRVGYWNGAEWLPMGEGLPGSNYYGVQSLLQTLDGSILAGCALDDADTPGIHTLMRWDGESWSPLGEFLSGTIQAMAMLPDGRVVVAHNYGLDHGASACRCLVWDGGKWTAIGASTTDSTLFCLLVLPGGDLVVGGLFDDIDGVPARSVARWDGYAWHALGSGVAYPQGAQRGVVSSLALDSDGDLLVGGFFSTAGGQVSANFARYRFCDCAADFNHDGLVNADDFDAFSDAFESALPAADTNHDSFVNADDYDLFAQRFDEGC